MEETTKCNQENIQLSDKEIFTKIWASPRLVFKFINDNHYDKYVTVLLILSGISKAFDRASLKNLGDKMSISAILMICIVGGGFFGWISIYIYAGLLRWTGEWLGGIGNSNSILRMLSYALLPSAIALILLVPQIGIYGNEIFKSEGDITSADWLSNVLVYGSMFLEVVLGLWTIIFCVVGTSEVQGLSIGKSILNLLLPVIVIGIPIVILVILIVG